MSHQIGTQTWFSIPSLDLDSDSTTPVSGNNNLSRGNKNFIRLFGRKNIDFRYISDTGENGKKAFDNKIRKRYSSPNDECFVGLEITSENVLMKLK